jgi:hypothetical protein
LAERAKATYNCASEPKHLQHKLQQLSSKPKTSAEWWCAYSGSKPAIKYCQQCRKDRLQANNTRERCIREPDLFAFAKGGEQYFDSRKTEATD